MVVLTAPKLTPKPAMSDARPPAPLSPSPPPRAPDQLSEPHALPAWRAFARPFDAGDKRPRIAILVTDLGHSEGATEAAITELPGAVTLAFNPYARNLDVRIREAREQGHEVMLMLLIEPADDPESKDSPTPYTLLTTLDEAHNLERLDWALNRVGSYVGLADAPGGSIAEAPPGPMKILEAIQKRGLLYVAGDHVDPALLPEIRAIALPLAEADMVLDTDPSKGAIETQLVALEDHARLFGNAIGFVSAEPATIDLLVAWTATLEGKNLVLAPASAVAVSPAAEQVAK